MGDIMTNMGPMSVEDYLDIRAMQYGFKDYEDLRSYGFDINLPEEEHDTEQCTG